ncbi:hypothetical protein Pcinc_009274 [Petrolisthes cinctipes]|uniref:CCHC-type domain-containing protein n=1 Tax=Petrolisthes cinctipes TaxID=88211 RepID=A0AAE1KWN6_PETCI|nr:hypothetical protein Pcinc_009274 [Petrolisthes cinctipes]
MSSTESVDSLKVNGVCINDKEEVRKAIKEFWENIGGVGEVTDVRGENVTLEWKDAEELNVRISREEVERCVKRQKNCKAPGPDDIPYEMYKNGGAADTKANPGINTRGSCNSKSKSASLKDNERVARTRRAEEAEQRRDDDRRRAEKAEIRRQEFATFMATLTTRPPSSPPNGTQQPTQHNKRVIKPPTPLQADATFQQFRDCRRRWQDYSVMTDLSTISLTKQYIQLRTCLGQEILHILQYRLQLPQDDSTPMEEVLNILDKYFKAQTNEALRRRDLFSCRQEAGETFNDFYLRVKKLAEAVDICKGGDKGCEETQLKQIILMGVSDQDLVQDLITITSMQSLDTVVQRCYAHEAARHTATAITSTEKSTGSRYKKEKKEKRQQQCKSPTPSTAHKACTNCGTHHAKDSCPAAHQMCTSCGRQGHRPRTVRCPATGATCDACGKMHHFKKHCRSTKPVGEAVKLQYNAKVAAPSTQTQQRSGAPRISSLNRDPTETTPPVIINVEHNKGIGVHNMLPDTGADTSIIGLDHLHSIGLKQDDLKPPPQEPTYAADGAPMQPAIGSVQVHLQLKGNRIAEWIDVHPSIPLPLLSYRACRELSIIPERFHHPIAQVTHARVRQGDQCIPSDTAFDNEDMPTGISTPCQDQQPPFTTRTTLAQAREYFLRTYKDVLRDRATQSRYNSRALQLPILPVDQRVRIQDPVNKRWYRSGTVVAQPRPRQYDIRLPNSRVIKRNRIFLHPIPATEGEATAPAADTTTTLQDPPVPRRSPRLQQRRTSTTS